MKISKAEDKQIRALALELAGDLDDYSASLTQKALDASTGVQELIDEMRLTMNELEADTFATYEKWISNATRDIETCA